MQSTVRLEHRQQPSLSPRLQHAVRLLQLSSLDFAQEVQNAVYRNPFLETEEAELAEEAEAGLPGPAEAADRVTPLEAGLAESFDSEADAGPTSESALERATAETDAMEPIGQDDRDAWVADGSMPRGSGEGEVSALDLMPAESSLRAHLHGQLNVLPLSERDLLLAKAIVESLDDDGYLRTPLSDLLEDSGLDPQVTDDELRIALKRVQSLEPLGVAATSVSECLLLQLPAITCPEQRALARVLVDEHLEALAAKDISRLAKATGATEEDVEAACKRIRRLDPRPGWRFDSSQARYVVPDVIVRKVRRQWSVSLNPAIVPRVRMNHRYAEMYRRHRGPAGGELAAHLQEARWTVRNVEQRFATILAVAEAIVKRQYRFFELGALAMRPLGLKEIAEEVGLHESTVSRVTNNKYMSTPLGVFELKYFFSRAMTATSGGTYSGTAIRGLIKNMIEEEKPKSPLSDAQIARRLAQQGLTIARRTVTKYRQQLKIESVERRRSHAPA